MWTKIVSEADVKKMKMNSRLLKFTGNGTPLDPPIIDPAYTSFVLDKNTGGSLSLKSTGHNPLFSSFGAGSGGLQKTTAQLIEEGIWWY